MAITRRLKLVILLSVLCSLVFYVEYFSGVMKTSHWPEFVDSNGNSFRSPNLEKDETLRILLVADPQIIGEQNEKRFLGPISRWDSDRYLHRYYKMARNHVQPHIVVFLGDLMDEGTEAHDVQYRRYVKRFNEVFELPRRTDPSLTEYIYLPGDNDVGGENEPVDPIKLKWFNLTFGDFDNQYYLHQYNWSVQFLKFWSIALPSTTSPQNYMEKITSISPGIKDGFRIILSHLPYWKHGSTSFREMVAKLKAAIIFSGNDHRSSLITFAEDDFKLYQRTTKFLHSDSTNVTNQVHKNFYRINLKRTSDKVMLHEISVPTCSYRMGVDSMGFGAAKIYKNGTMDYTVLWLPSRFRDLGVYLAVYICWKLIFTPWILWRLYCLAMQKWRNRRDRPEKAPKHEV